MPVTGTARVTFAPAVAYEYHVLGHSDHSQGAHELREELNQLGREGWLLITDYEEKLILARPLASPRQAVSGRVTVEAASPDQQGEPPMPQLTVDSAGNAKFQFDDDHDDIVGPPQGDGSGIVVTFSSDNPSVASLANPVGVAGTDANGLPQFLAPLTFGVDGTFNLSAEVTNESGAPLVDDDGTTAFVQAPAVAVPVAGGQATTGTTSESAS